MTNSTDTLGPLTYIQNLYNDYTLKIKNIHKYIEKIQTLTKELESQTGTWANRLNTKYTALATGSHNQKPHTSLGGNFALEPSQPKPSLPKKENNEIDLQELDIYILQYTKNIDYTFQKAETSLQFLVQSYQDLQELTNKIWDAWNDLIGTTNIP